jgi:hypothetical protein
LRVKLPSARAMSAATDGFSAMMSFFDMGLPEKGAEDTCKARGVTTSWAAPPCFQCNFW